MAYYLETLALLIILTYFFYKWSTRNFHVFKERGVAHEKPIPLLGNAEFGIFFGTKSILKDTIERYQKYKKNKIYGVYSFNDPQFVICDVELIKKIGIKDFDHFVNHKSVDMSYNERVMGRNLLSLRDLQWKEMRNTLSPSFTGSKMRLMHEFVNECCLEGVHYINEEIDKSKEDYHEIELKDFFSRYANDIIGTVAFGIKVNSLKDQTNKFYEAGKSFTQFRVGLLVKALLYMAIPKVMKRLRVTLLDQQVLQYFRSLVFDAIKYRQEHKIVRPDMIHLLLEAKRDFEANGAVHNEAHATFDDDDLLAQCLIFFLAGFETVSNALCFTFYELVMNQDIQTQLYEEIMAVEADLEGKPLSYDALKKMSYLDMVLSEGLRKWPPAIFTDRICNTDYTLKPDDGDLSVEIKKGEQLLIPIFGLHHDAEIFAEPEKFIPERFSEEQKKNMHPCSYLPFGIGPRNCIGNRLALMETKTMIYYIVKNFKIEKTAKTPADLLEAIKGFQLLPPEKFWMKFSKRNN